MFATARLLFLSRGRLIKRTASHSIPLKFVLILFSLLAQVLKEVSFFQVPQENPVNIFVPTIRATFTTHLILLHMITTIILSEECKSRSSS